MQRANRKKIFVKILKIYLEKSLIAFLCFFIVSCGFDNTDSYVPRGNVGISSSKRLTSRKKLKRRIKTSQEVHKNTIESKSQIKEVKNNNPKIDNISLVVHKNSFF
ncbi:hypothetical protein B488_12380 [Liberibacter crescens BT-1]|uniref:Lipoprotein n=3 Tax=Liberibacter crescens TaxID=1273132 RepID=L0EWK0_LIBCB|nr:hypothetical protein B488_12380 [Liberibacter crescens BT-1]